MKKIEFKSKYSTGAYKLEFDSDSSEEEKEKTSVKTKKSKGVPYVSYSFVHFF